MGSKGICSSTLTLRQLSERSTLSGANLHLLTELPSTLRPRQLSVNFLTPGVRQLSELSKNSENFEDSEFSEYSDNSELSEN